MNYYMNLEWDDKTSIKTKIEAIYNVLNFVSREMSIGRVPNNKIELENNLNLTEKRLRTPLSIAFVKMVENGEIDEVTASENADMFLNWNENITYNAGDFRTYFTEENGIKLYKCLQAHTSQADWTPDVSSALWKEVGITENGIPKWSQPISSADAYMIGDEVMYNDVHYKSIIDNNVWPPDAYPQGWEIVQNNI